MKPRILLLLFGLSMAAWANPLQWKTLRMAPSADTRRVRALLEALPTRTKGWKHEPLWQGGNFLSERWLTGEGEVLNEAFMVSPGAGWYQVQALSLKLPETFGCLLSAGRNPARDGVGVRFWYASGGQTIVGEGADLAVTIWKEGRVQANLPVLQVPLLLPEPFEVEGREPAKSWRVQLASLADPKTFQSGTLERYARVSTEFRQALAQSRVKKRVYEEYQSGGLPPQSSLVAITSAEADVLRGYVDTQVARWKQDLEQNQADIYTTFHQVVPLEALLD